MTDSEGEHYLPAWLDSEVGRQEKKGLQALWTVIPLMETHGQEVGWRGPFAIIGTCWFWGQARVPEEKCPADRWGPRAGAGVTAEDADSEGGAWKHWRERKPATCSHSRLVLRWSLQPGREKIPRPSGGWCLQRAPRSCVEMDWNGAERDVPASSFFLFLFLFILLPFLPPPFPPPFLLSLLIPSALPARVTSGESHWSLFPKHAHLNLFWISFIQTEQRHKH